MAIIAAALSGTPILASAETADTAAPQAEFITLSPPTIPASGGEVTVEFIVTDEGSGLAENNSAGDKIPSIVFKLKNSQSVFVPTNSVTRFKGDEKYGSYRTVVSISRAISTGTWELFINPLRDLAGNSSAQIPTGLSFIFNSTSTPTSPASSGGSGAPAPTTPELPLPTSSIMPSPMATPSSQGTPTPSQIASPTATPLATSTKVLASPSPTPSATKAATNKAVSKLKTITCRKGKLIKKVNGINPKCPKGYK